MSKKPSLHDHAIDRLHERFDKHDSWLLQELENGRFVWLKGHGNSGSMKKVRSGHLIYIPDTDEYCVVIMDDRSRLAITVLTEDMAIKSSWGRGLTDAAKLKAKRIALGKESVDDTNFLILYAEERGSLDISVRAKTYSYDWKPKMLSVCKVKIYAEQINTERKCCTLRDSQAYEVSQIIQEKINTKEIQPYGELFVSTARGKIALISNVINGFLGLECAESRQRWD